MEGAMAYDPYRYHSQWDTYDHQRQAASGWALGILVLFIFGVLVLAAINRSANVTMDDRTSTQIETTGYPTM